MRKKSKIIYNSMSIKHINNIIKVRYNKYFTLIRTYCTELSTQIILDYIFYTRDKIKMIKINKTDYELELKLNKNNLHYNQIDKNYVHLHNFIIKLQFLDVLLYIDPNELCNQYYNKRFTADAIKYYIKKKRFYQIINDYLSYIHTKYIKQLSNNIYLFTNVHKYKHDVFPKYENIKKCEIIHNTNKITMYRYVSKPNSYEFSYYFIVSNVPIPIKHNDGTIHLQNEYNIIDPYSDKKIMSLLIQTAEPIPIKHNDGTIHWQNEHKYMIKKRVKRVKRISLSDTSSDEELFNFYMNNPPNQKTTCG